MPAVRNLILRLGKEAGGYPLKASSQADQRWAFLPEDLMLFAQKIIENEPEILLAALRDNGQGVAR